MFFSQACFPSILIKCVDFNMDVGGSKKQHLALHGLQKQLLPEVGVCMISISKYEVLCPWDCLGAVFFCPGAQKPGMDLSWILYFVNVCPMHVCGCLVRLCVSCVSVPVIHIMYPCGLRVGLVYVY